MISHPARETLVMALDGELAAEELAAVVAHMDECAECKNDWRQMVALSAQLREYHIRLPHTAPRTALVVPIGRRLQRFLWPAVAAGVLLALWGWRSRVTQPPVALPELVYLALPYSDRSLPLENPVAVEVKLPRKALWDAGLPIPDVPGDGSVTVELLLGLDGQPRALRLARVNNFEKGELRR
jgi:anti-sigma factor RsiW